MPLYNRECRECGHTDTEFDHIANVGPHNRLIECPACHAMAYERTIEGFNTDLKTFHTPIEMHSVAATSWEEIREIQEKCPDVQISDNPDDELFGVPIAKNRKEKKQVLAAVGYVENN